MPSVARKRSTARHAAARSAADVQAGEDGNAPSTVSNTYTVNSAVMIAAQVYDHLRLASVLEELVPDVGGNRIRRKVTVRTLIVMMIAHALCDQPLYLTRIAANLSSNKRVHGRQVRILRKKTRKILGLSKRMSVTRDMVQNTHDALKLALAETFKIEGDRGGSVEDTLLNLLGIDLPKAAIAASGSADFYAQSASRAVDTTFVDSIAARPTRIDENTGQILHKCYDPSARTLYRTPTKRDKRDRGLGHYIETATITRDLPPNQTEFSPDDEPYVGVCDGARFHNRSHSGHEVVRMLDIIDAFGTRVDTVIADRGFTNSVPEKWAIPLRERGMRLVHDLREDQRGRFPLATVDRKDGTTITLVVIDGLIFEDHVADWLDTQDLLDLPRLPINNKANRKKRNALLDKYDYRAKFAWRVHDRATPTSFRLRGPSHTAARTAYCPNTTDPNHLGDPKQFTLDHTPCTHADTCHCRQLVTIRLDIADNDHKKFAKIRQHRSWGGRSWDNHYGTRALVESFYAEFKGNITQNSHSLAVRTIGLEAPRIPLHHRRNQHRPAREPAAEGRRRDPPARQRRTRRGSRHLHRATTRHIAGPAHPSRPRLHPRPRRRRLIPAARRVAAQHQPRTPDTSPEPQGRGSSAPHNPRRHAHNHL